MLSSLHAQRLCYLRCPSINFSKQFKQSSKGSKWRLMLNKNASDCSSDSVSSVGLKCLIRPFLFTTSFSGCCFVAASIWQYEEMRKMVQFFQFNPQFELYSPKYKRYEIRRKVNSWWHSQSEGEKIASIIIGINLFVFLLWRIPALQPVMQKYFCSSPALGSSCLPMILSTFSHFSFLHLAANMYVLYSFSTTAVAFFGKEQFLAVYCSAGVISSFASYVYKVLSGQLITSLGASGALMAILSSVCFQFPNTPLQIIFLPFFTFTAGYAIKAIMALDFVGLIAKWRLFDHAAHLGGALFGIVYLNYGLDYIWGKREHIFAWYHNVREGKK